MQSPLQFAMYTMTGPMVWGHGLLSTATARQSDMSYDRHPCSIDRLLPVCDDLRARGDGRSLLAGAEVRAVSVAGEERVCWVRDRVIGVPLALNATLANRCVVRLKTTSIKYISPRRSRSINRRDSPSIGCPTDVVAQDTAVSGDLGDAK